MLVSAFKLINDTGMKWFCTLLQYKILHNLKKRKKKFRHDRRLFQSKSIVPDVHISILNQALTDILSCNIPEDEG